MTLAPARQADVVKIADEFDRRDSTAAGVDGLRLRRIWSAFENQSLVIATDPATDTLVGYGANVPQPTDQADAQVLLLTGEVFEGFRGNGWGRQLVQWCVDRARTDASRSVTSAARPLPTRLVCEHRDESGRLHRLLARLGFDAHEFNEVTRSVEGLRPEESILGSMSISPIQPELVSWLEERQRSGDTGGLAGHGEWSIAQVWRDKHREPGACLVARRGDETVGYIIGMRYPGAPQDLWVEVLHADPTLLRDHGYEALLQRAAHAIGLRDGTVSMGWPSREPPEGWHLSGSWWRCILTIGASGHL